MTSFIHLRAHSGYSLLEGALQPSQLVAMALDHQMPAIAMTDSANLFGALEFSQAAQKKGVQPIHGCVVPLEIADTSEQIVRKGQQDKKLPSILLLVANQTGYQNLLSLISIMWLESNGQDSVRATLEMLREYADGLICLDGGALGPIARHVVEGRDEEAHALARHMATMFPDRFYIEIMRHGLESEKVVEPRLIAIADELRLPLVATNDIHFLTEGMFEAQDVLSCIGQSVNVDVSDRHRLTPEHRFKSSKEMQALFADLPDALENSVHIARRCACMSPSRDPILPQFDTGDGRSETEELRYQAQQGLELRLAEHVLHDGLSDEERVEKRRTYEERLAYELGVIEQMQFPGYFLIVSDFIKWAKEQGIPVGPGRGSGAGSVVAWSLLITDLDPLRFGLLFERFLNPERVSMPDFDIDFCQDGRERVIRYVQEKYGHDRVAAIITFGKLQARAAIRDVGRALGMSYTHCDRISKMVPHNPANPPTLKEALTLEPRLKEEQKSDERVAQLLDIAMKLEGLPRHASTHAAGLVIGDRPLVELVPLYRDPRSTMPVTQFNMKDVEKAGLVKFDFLGLTTLTVLDHASRMIEEQGGHVEFATLPLDDAGSYEVMARGETGGVFQLESSGMRDALRKLKPDCFEDIIAMVSLYRPGPMDNIPRYIRVKHGEEPPEYMHELLEPILGETNGVIIYQEQVMQIAQDLANYTLGGADLLRRAMGKKIKAEMDAQTEVFVSGAVGRGIEEDLAKTIFDSVAKFASYGFNKSHAAAYALVSYHTAWCKAHHPVEFYAASMTMERDNSEKLTLFRQELKKRKIPLLPPDVNRSKALFSVDFTDDGEKGVRYALSAIRGVGTAAMDALCEERAENGPFLDLFELCSRMTTAQINKRLLEGLIRSGALDQLHPGRAWMEAAIEPAMRYAAAYAEEKTSSQVSLFGTVEEGSLPKPIIEPVPEWPEMQRLQYEFQALGAYFSSHPLAVFERDLGRIGVIHGDEIEGRIAQGSMPIRPSFAGVIVSRQFRITEKTRLANVMLSDTTRTFEFTVFSELLAQTRDLLEVGNRIIIHGLATLDEGNLRITANEIELLEDAIGGTRGLVEITLGDPSVLKKLRPLIETSEERTDRIRLCIPYPDGQIAVISLPEHCGLTAAKQPDIRRLEGVDSVTTLN